MDRKQTFSKTIVSRVISSIVLKSDRAFWGGEQLLSPKIEIMVGGSLIHPPKVLRTRMRELGIHSQDLPKHIICQKLRVRNYRDLTLRWWSKLQFLSFSRKKLRLAVAPIFMKFSRLRIMNWKWRPTNQWMLWRKWPLSFPTGSKLSFARSWLLGQILYADSN